MRLYTTEEREARSRAYPEGTRVRAVRFATENSSIDDNETVPPGTEGTVSGPPDAAGSVPVRWENGSTISVLPEDRIEVIA